MLNLIPQNTKLPSMFLAGLMLLPNKVFPQKAQNKEVKAKAPIVNLHNVIKDKDKNALAEALLENKVDTLLKIFKIKEENRKELQAEMEGHRTFFHYAAKKLKTEELLALLKLLKPDQISFLVDTAVNSNGRNFIFNTIQNPDPEMLFKTLDYLGVSLNKTSKWISSDDKSLPLVLITETEPEHLKKLLKPLAYEQKLEFIKTMRTIRQFRPGLGWNERSKTLIEDLTEEPDNFLAFIQSLSKEEKLKLFDKEIKDGKIFAEFLFESYSGAELFDSYVEGFNSKELLQILSVDIGRKSPFFQLKYSDDLKSKLLLRLSSEDLYTLASKTFKGSLDNIIQNLLEDSSSPEDIKLLKEIFSKLSVEQRTKLLSLEVSGSEIILESVMKAKDTELIKLFIQDIPKQSLKAIILKPDKFFKENVIYHLLSRYYYGDSVPQILKIITQGWSQQEIKDALLTPNRDGVTAFFRSMTKPKVTLDYILSLFSKDELKKLIKPEDVMKNFTYISAECRDTIFKYVNKKQMLKMILEQELTKNSHELYYSHNIISSFRTEELKLFFEDKDISLEDKRAWLNKENNYGDTAIYSEFGLGSFISEGSADKLIYLMKFLTKEERLSIFLEDENRYIGKPLISQLVKAGTDTEIINKFISRLSPEELKAVLFLKNSDGELPIHLAWRQSDELSKYLLSLTPDENLQELLEYEISFAEKQTSTLRLLFILNKSDALYSVLERVPKQKVKEWLKANLDLIENRASGDFFLKCIKLLPPEDASELILTEYPQYNNKQVKSSILTMKTSDRNDRWGPRHKEAIYKLIAKEKLRKRLLSKDKISPLLYSLVSDREIPHKYLLDLLNDKELKNIITKLRDKKNNSILHIAAQNSNHKFFNLLLTRLPMDEFFKLLQLSNDEGYTVLNIIETDSALPGFSMKSIFYGQYTNASNPEIEEFLMKESRDGVNYFDKMLGAFTLGERTNNDLYELPIYRMLPQSNRLRILKQEIQRYGQSALHYLAEKNDAQNIDLVWKGLHSENNTEFKAKVLELQDYKGDTAMHIVARNNNNQILELFQENLQNDTLVKILSIKNKRGDNAWSLAHKYKSEKFIDLCKKRLSEEEVEELNTSLNLKNIRDISPFIHAISEGNIPYLNKKLDKPLLAKNELNNTQDSILIAAIKSKHPKALASVHKVFSKLSEKQKLEILSGLNKHLKASEEQNLLALAIKNQKHLVIESILKIMNPKEVFRMLAEKDKAGVRTQDYINDGKTIKILKKYSY